MSMVAAEVLYCTALQSETKAKARLLKKTKSRSKTDAQKTVEQGKEKKKKKEWVMCMPNENDELCLLMLLKGLRSEQSVQS